MLLYLRRFWNASFGIKLFVVLLAWLSIFAVMSTSEIVLSVLQHLLGVPEEHIIQPPSDLTLLSTATGTVAPLLAIVGGCIAYYQLRNAERTRLAQVYIEINKRWNAEPVQRSIRLVAKVQRQFESDAARLSNFAAYLDAALRQEDEKVLHDQPSDYDTMVEVLNFLEDVGLMCRNGYVKTADVYDFVGSSIIHFTESFMVHIRAVRQGDRTTIYANALWLYENQTPRFQIDGYGG